MTGRLTRRERWFVGVGAVLAAAIGAGYAVMLAPARSVEPSEEVAEEVQAPPREFTEADAPLPEFVERLRREGVPTTLREAAARDVPRSDVNAELQIEAALIPLEIGFVKDGEPRTWPWMGASALDEETPEALAQLAPLAPLLDDVVGSLSKALAHDRCRLRPDEQGADPDMGPLRTRLRAQRALAAASLVLPAPERRIEACRCLLRFGRLDEPTTVLDHSGELALVAAGMTTMRHGVEHGTIDPVAAHRALDGLLAASAFERLSPSLTGEVGASLDLARRALHMSAEDRRRIGVLREPTAAERAVIARQVVAGIEAMRAVAALPRTPRSEFLRKVRAAANVDAPMAKMLPPFALRLVRSDAAAGLARIALAAAEYRATHGDFPASLDELRPMFADGVPLDPFTDAPFVYEKTATGARIASQGRLTDETPLDEATLREKCLVWDLKR